MCYNIYQNSYYLLNLDFFFYQSEYYTDCNEAYMQGETCSGVYTIKPDNYPPFDVRQFCTLELELAIVITAVLIIGLL
jgi:hypothetical protein